MPSLTLHAGTWTGITNLNGCQDCRDVINWAPLVLQDVQADSAISIYCNEHEYDGQCAFNLGKCTNWINKLCSTYYLDGTLCS